MKIKRASFSNGIGKVEFENGTIQSMTYDEYIVMCRNFQYSSVAKLIRHIQEKGAFYSAGYNRSIHRVTVFEKRMEIFDLRDGILTKDEHRKVAKLILRYQRFYHYCKEVSPHWQEIDRVHYADNSIESIQVNKYGEKRNVLVTAPHGDACY